MPVNATRLIASLFPAQASIRRRAPASLLFAALATKPTQAARAPFSAAMQSLVYSMSVSAPTSPLIVWESTRSYALRPIVVSLPAGSRRQERAMGRKAMAQDANPSAAALVRRNRGELREMLAKIHIVSPINA